MNPYLMTPNIIRESSEGTTYCPIQDELFNRQRSVEAVGEISRESVYSLILQLRYLQHADPEKGITMYINSPGGSVQDGLALYDVMAALSCPVRTVCVGMAASMGALLFAAGSDRDILPHASVMMPRVGKPELYVSTSVFGTFGAAVMLYEGLLDSFAEEHGGDFYIMPSSLHELIFVSDFGQDKELLAEMVREVNATVLDTEDILSDHLYHYCAKKRQITIAV